MTSALENFYYRKNEVVREKLRGTEAKIGLKKIVNDRISNLINLLSKCLFFGVFLMDGGVLTAGFIKTFMDLD